VGSDAAVLLLRTRAGATYHRGRPSRRVPAVSPSSGPSLLPSPRANSGQDTVQRYGRSLKPGGGNRK